MTLGRAAALGLAIGIGVGARIVLAVAFVGNYDERSYEVVAEIMRRGGNIYAETARYNYTPVWAVIVHGLDSVSQTLDLPLHAVIRTFLTGVDGLNALFIGAIARDQGRSMARTVIVYLLNPVAILIVGLHGQFETLAALPILVSIVLAGRRTARAGAWTWLLGTAGLVIKHIFAFQLWMLFWYSFKPTRRAVLLGCSTAVFLASFAPYLPLGADGIQRNVFGYAGLPGIYGFGSLVPYPIATLLFVVVMAALPLWTIKRGLDVAGAVQLSAVVMLATIFGIGEQYFLIPVLFSTAFRGRWYWTYTAAATLFLVASRNNLDLLPIPAPWNLVWLAALGWAIHLALRPTGRSGSARSNVTIEPAGG